MTRTTAITKNLKTTSNLSILYPQCEFSVFYQQLFCGLSNIEKLGKRLVKKAEAAQAFRQTKILEEVATILVNLPAKEYQLIGEYYLAWLALRSRSIRQDVFGRVYDLSSSYKAQALWSLAAIEAANGNTEEELKLYLESLRASSDLPTFIATTRGIAVAKAKEEFHKQAVGDLESLVPLIRYASPFTYFAVLNSLAVEMGEVGRIEEASRICQVVLASPFASAYPEWRETAQDLREHNRSFVAIPSIKQDHLKPETSQTPHAQKPQPQANVLPFSPLKKAPEPEKPEQLTPQEINELSLIEKRDLILAAIRTSQMSELEYNKLMVAVGLLKSGPTDKIIDLEDEQTLDDIAVVWANNVGPEEFAAVLSALRDCEDSRRQKDIMDRMIRKAFEQSQQCGLTEEAWRLEFERRLPKK